MEAFDKNQYAENHKLGTALPSKASQIIFSLVIGQSSQTNNFSHHQYTGWFLSFLNFIYFVLMNLFQVDGKKKRKGSKVNKQLAYI